MLGCPSDSGVSAGSGLSMDVDTTSGLSMDIDMTMESSAPNTTLMQNQAYEMHDVSGFLHILRIISLLLWLLTERKTAGMILYEWYLSNDECR